MKSVRVLRLLGRPIEMTSRIQTNHNDEPLASVSENAIDNRPHLDTIVWLKTLELTQYRSLFQKFRGVEVRDI